MLHRLIFHAADSVFGLALLALVVGSQVYWVRRIRRTGRRLIANQRLRSALGAAMGSYLILVIAGNLLPVFAPLAHALGSTLPAWLAPTHSPTRLTWRSILLEAPFQLWIFGSVVGFLIVLLIRAGDALASIPGRIGRAIARRDPQPAPVSLERRRFLERSAMAFGSVPFAAGAYGLVWGRLDLEMTKRRIQLARLPRGFAGFRIAQLSDFHIGPFMTATELRKCAELANGLKPDLIVVTGDFVTWDASTQGAAVDALSGLSAPYGVFGCLGNHELWTHTEDSITRLFRERGIRILRHERAGLEAGGDRMNLIGVDFQTHTSMGTHHEGLVREYLAHVEPLIQPDQVNILLSHNPNTFDRAAALGIDLSLAGHTHGGQVALEFVSPEISPSRLITPYVAGWFGKPGGQLYVNRGLGTIGVPIRVGAPPEITVFELV